MPDTIFDTLSGFFDTPGDWSFVIAYKDYGITAVTRDPDTSGYGYVKKRIVVHTLNARCWSIIWISTSTPSGYWEAVPLNGAHLDGEPQHYTTAELFEALRDNS